ncbi:MAG: hypothetical protein ACKVZJ_12830 [Phycisphaerales bacterium]
MSPAIAKLRVQLREHRAELRRLGLDPDIYRELMPFVRWTRGEAVVEPHPTVTGMLERLLGPRLPPLDKPIKRPRASSLLAEIRRQLEKGVDPEVAPAVAEMELVRNAMRAAKRDPALERETPGWEAATGAAVAAVAIKDGSPLALQNADEYFERLDTARGPAEARKALEEKLKRITDGRRKGGAAPKRKPEIWRHVVELVAKNPRITLATAWNSFPEPNGGADDSLVLRWGDVLVETDDRTNKQSVIKRRSFERYLTDAKREQRQKLPQ